MNTPPIKVLFLCTGNSCRSQMAEGLLRSLGGERFEVHSAGTEPKYIHPMAIRAMAEVGVDISGQRSKPIDEFLDQEFDYIITVCDRARDNCPTFPGDSRRIHWSFEDPAAATGSDEQRMQLFRKVRGELSNRLKLWTTTFTRHRASASA